ncbi:DDE-type integrase/transposase/recombinase [Micromonospora sp. NPDC047548]|uniref:DDE-type integrase/transposase/recombinase n=1 Tax=Micromonospora sp. NPDC047548 TaxID=3155624 RepID=UPI0033FCF6D5
MTTANDEARVRADRARKIALWRYQLIREPADPAYSTRQRGRMVRQLAEREHPGPFGTPVRVARATLDRWITAWRRGGFDALVPSPRQATPRTPAEILDMAAALKRENPDRTAAQVARILHKHLGWAPSESTVLRHLNRLELMGPPATAVTVFGRFEADRPGELWVGDALHGPAIGGRKTYLFAFLDDHSRLLVGHRFGYAEDTVRLAAALRPALASRGVPESIYVDNGSAFVDAWLLRACASLGVKLVHSTPGRPQGRGKIERFFRTVRDQFLVELSTPDTANLVTDLVSLNRLFTAWTETEYHRSTHSETGQTPLHRWQAGDPPRLPSPAALREAFLWEAARTVTKTATVSLHGNTYQVDAGLVGRRVELVFDPFDLTNIEIRCNGKPMGLAIPHRIGRHAHPKAKPETPEAPPPASGIGYLKLVDAAHQAELADRVNYTALSGPTDPTLSERDTR